MKIVHGSKTTDGDMKKYKVTYKCKNKASDCTWKNCYKIVEAVSEADAKKRADLWIPLIKEVELVKPEK
jgi:hypothetical protein